MIIIIVGWFKTKDGSPSWTLGRIEMTEMIKHMIKLKLMKNLFRWQPLDWKVSWEIMLSLDYRIRCKKSSALPLKDEIIWLPHTHTECRFCIPVKHGISVVAKIISTNSNFAGMHQRTEGTYGVAVMQVQGESFIEPAIS